MQAEASEKARWRLTNRRADRTAKLSREDGGKEGSLSSVKVKISTDRPAVARHGLRLLIRIDFGRVTAKDALRGAVERLGAIARSSGSKCVMTGDQDCTGQRSAPVRDPLQVPRECQQSPRPTWHVRGRAEFFMRPLCRSLSVPEIFACRVAVRFRVVHGR